MNHTFNVPQNWKTIDESEYAKYSIINNDDCPCIKAYAIDKPNGVDVVSIFKYEGQGKAFLSELKAHLQLLAMDANKVEEVNKYISDNVDNPEDSMVETLVPIYYKPGTLCGKKAFINVMRITNQNGKAYSVQIFVLTKHDILCFSTSTQLADEKDIFASIISKNPHVSDMINQTIAKL